MACTSNLGEVNVSLSFMPVKSAFQFHLVVLLTRVDDPLISTLKGRTCYMPFMADGPPSSLPQGHEMGRLPTLALCSVVWGARKMVVVGVHNGV